MVGGHGRGGVSRAGSNDPPAGSRHHCPSLSNLSKEASLFRSYVAVYG
jgi:hypothetical protein